MFTRHLTASVVTSCAVEAVVDGGGEVPVFRAAVLGMVLVVAVVVTGATVVVNVADVNASVSGAAVDVYRAAELVVAGALVSAELESVSGVALVSVLGRSSVMARLVLVLNGDMV